jgi:hypothetical protein
MTKLPVEFVLAARLLRGVAVYEDFTTITTPELEFYAAYLYQPTSLVLMFPQFYDPDFGLVTKA